MGGLALALALVHAIGVGRYLSSGPAVIALAALVVVPFASLAALRLTTSPAVDRPPVRGQLASLPRAAA